MWKSSQAGWKSSMILQTSNTSSSNSAERKWMRRWNLKIILWQPHNTHLGSISNHFFLADACSKLIPALQNEPKNAWQQPLMMMAQLQRDQSMKIMFTLLLNQGQQLAMAYILCNHHFIVCAHFQFQACLAWTSKKVEKSWASSVMSSNMTSECENSAAAFKPSLPKAWHSYLLWNGKNCVLQLSWNSEFA